MPNTKQINELKVILLDRKEKLLKIFWEVEKILIY